MSIQLRGLHPVVRLRAQWALDVARHYRVPVTVTSTVRTRQQQQHLYEQWKLGKSKWPANPPGYSAHEYGLAFDSTVPEQLWSWWSAVRTAAGFRVPPNDKIHAEVPHWRVVVGV